MRHLLVCVNNLHGFGVWDTLMMVDVEASRHMNRPTFNNVVAATNTTEKERIRVSN